MSINNQNIDVPSRTSFDSFYDVIIIGSGIGGLTAASILTQLYSLKVLVLEQHYTLGGLTHTFKRSPGYEWSTGVHYIGSMHQGSLERDIFDFITGNGVEWTSMPAAYDHFYYPDIHIRTDKDVLIYKETLINSFPHERKAIEKYFTDIKKSAEYAKRQIALNDLEDQFGLLGKMVKFIGSHCLKLTLLDYLNQNIQSPKLKAILSSQWGDYGIPPEVAPFALHAVIVDHYLNGAFYPKNGSAQIATKIQRIIESNGGVCLRNALAKKIIYANEQASSVIFIKNNKEYEIRSNFVISNVGIYGTGKLLNNGILKKNYTNLYKDALSSFTMYLGLDVNPKYIGLDGGNYWMFRNYDLVYNRNDLNVQECFLSSPPNQTEYFTASITSFLTYNHFMAFEHSNWRKRPDVYKKLKEELADKIWSLASLYVPHLKQHVIYQEVSTPLTIRHFIHSYNGVIYGVPHYKQMNYYKHCFEKNIKNLSLSGVDAAFPGVVGAMFGGIVATSRVIKEPFYKVLRKIKKQKL